MKEDSEKCLLETLALAKEMKEMADKGDSARCDVGCGVLYGTLRDYAYKIRSLAESEISTHQSMAAVKEKKAAVPSVSRKQ